MKEYIIKVNVSSELAETCLNTLSAKELVRCKDCKYAHKTYNRDCKYCDMFTDDDGYPIERYRSGNWFCADGEK
jgi:uncharacterized CHY-type Zn-finger protein